MHTAGGVDEDYGYSVQQTSDNGYILVGSHFISTQCNVWLTKWDSSGGFMWARMAGATGSNNEIGYCVQQTPDDGYIIAGAAQGYGNGSDDWLVVRTDSEGFIPGCALLTDVSPTIAVASISYSSVSPTVYQPTYDTVLCSPLATMITVDVISICNPVTTTPALSPTPPATPTPSIPILVSTTSTSGFLLLLVGFGLLFIKFRNGVTS